MKNECINLSVKEIESRISSQCKTLHIDCEDTETDIFYAGADSLKIVCLVAYIENAFKVQIRGDVFYPNSSIKSISEKISSLLKEKK